MTPLISAMTKVSCRSLVVTKAFVGSTCSADLHHDEVTVLDVVVLEGLVVVEVVLGAEVKALIFGRHLLPFMDHQFDSTNGVHRSNVKGEGLVVGGDVESHKLVIVT